MRRRNTIGSDANSSYYVSTSDVVLADYGLISAARVWTLDSSGASNGDEIEFLAFGTYMGNTIDIKNNGGSTLATLGNVAGGFRSARFMRLSGAWTLIGGVPHY